MRCSYLTNGDGQVLDNLLMCHGNNALAIYFNDSVSNTNTASLRDATSHQTADLQGVKKDTVTAECKLFNKTVVLFRSCQPFSLGLNLKFSVTLLTDKRLLTMPF